MPGIRRSEKIDPAAKHDAKLRRFKPISGAQLGGQASRLYVINGKIGLPPVS